MPARRGRIALLVFCTAGCYAPAQARYDLAPSWQPQSVRVSPAAPRARLRLESFAMAGFSGSGITRRWPLMDSRTRSERYTFRVQESGSDLLEARCRVLNIADDHLRERTSVDCALTDHAEASPGWQLTLSGRTRLTGALTGPTRTYHIVPHGDSMPVPAAARVPMPDYQIMDGALPVALVQVKGRRAWLNPALDATDRGGVMAVVFSLLVQHDERYAGR